ncbi:MAG: hypothetical protein HY037_01055 [Nitrospirae bacterium]|nr:hypothetical protein [Candidatus Troglogloeales bacterium]
MKQTVLHEILRVDANHQIHLNLPAEAGDEFEVIVMPGRSQDERNMLSDEEQLMLAGFWAVTPDDPEEDAIWGKYLHE